MSRVEIAGPINQYERILYAIQAEGVLHLESIPIPENGRDNSLGRPRLSEEEQSERAALEALQESLSVVFDGRSDTVRSLLRQELERSTSGEFRLLEADLRDNRNAARIGYPRPLAHDVASFLVDAGIGRLNLPHYLRDKRFESALSELETDLDSLRDRLRGLEQRLIPELKGQAAYIRSVRDQREREDLFRMKRLKKKSELRWKLIEGVMCCCRSLFNPISSN